MYRVLIVDDEPEIRQGLRLKVNWENLGLTLVGEAGNGVEAMEKLAEEAFDIVITDMNMPLMNGVSLLEACHEQYPELRLLVISGYEDIRYAKAAVRNQARDYLLKPVARDELTEALTRLCKELDAERAEQAEAAVIQWRLSQYYKKMKEHFIVHFVKEKPSQERGVADRGMSEATRGAAEGQAGLAFEAARHYIDDNYMFDLNLTKIAERFNYNPSYFSEMFKAKVGKTFINYLTDVRMAHATRLLEETKLSLWDIAQLTGFSNASYFSSKFKRIYGMSPSEYRQQQPEKFNNEEPKK
ncbi:response regulator [Paenibacillus sp. P96]|uniref:Response regulator n=1 Tax=Paenibacillus zeirhizosphaerae TaxID=2987519 RepID=A0ABT9FVV0_9BACL|nr:response regulator [Paenibacillus sp. P96]MDP4098863.1 response regulator [Paenibacillus sp. P96]